jgi:hypothetical protein
MIKDVFTFGSEPQIDGSTPILKNGVRTVCPKSQMMAYENPNLIGKIVYERLGCNVQCPFFMSATKQIKDGESIDGYVLHCIEKPVFVQVEKESTIKPIFKIER